MACEAVLDLVRKMLVTTQRGTNAPSVPTVMRIAADCADAMIPSTAVSSLLEETARKMISLLNGSSSAMDDVFVVVSAVIVRRLQQISQGPPHLEELSSTWELFIRNIFLANPPYPPPVMTAAAYVSTVVFMELGLGGQLYDLALASLTVGGDGVELLLSSATELLTPLAAYVAQETTKTVESAAITTRIIDACFAFLGRSQADTSVTPLVTRRLLIPLIAHIQANTSFIERMHSLLQTLFERKLLAEQTVLTAALFDFLFSSVVAGTAKDYRWSPLLWNGMRDALANALESTEDAAGKRTTTQLQVTYLLKRIVAMSVAHPLPPGQDRFHDFFFWANAAQDEALWSQYFLVFETLNEYGVHINAPALAKLDDLFLAAARTQAPQSTGSSAAFSPVWLELLMTKAVLHPNIGVRKLILRKLWTFPVEWLQLLSQRFVAQIVFPAASDVRLSTDLDRVLLPGTFLECKVFDGREDHTLPKVRPLAEQMQAFYRRYFNEVCVTDAARVATLLAIITTVDLKTTRFTVAVCVRVLWFVIKHLTPPQSDSTAVGDSLLTPELISALQSFIRDQIHDRHPFWLEVRLNAMMLDLLLHVGSYVSTVINAPITLLLDGVAPAFRKLLSLCSVCGDTGGKSVVTIDATDSIGCVGAALPVGIAAAHILHFSPPLVFSKYQFEIATQLVRLDTFQADVQRVLESSCVDECRQFDESNLKETIAYVSCQSEANFGSLWRSVVGQLASCSSRSYVSVRQFCTLCQCFAEIAKNESFSSRLVASTDPGALSQVFCALTAYAQRSLQRANETLSSVTDFNDFSDVDGPWEALRTTHWDSVTAALSNSITIGLRRSTTAHGGIDSMSVSGTLHTFVELLGQLTHRPRDSITGLAQCGNILLCRSAARVLQSIASGFAAAGLESIEATLASLLPLEQRVSIVTSLLKHQCFKLHLNSSDTPTSLSGMTWGSIIAQYFRALYNLTYALLLATTADLGAPPTDSLQSGVLRKFVRDAADFGIDQLDACSTSNLSSLYDIVSWCLMAQKKMSEIDEATELGIDCERTVSSLLNRLDDTQRREYFRCAALAIYGMSFCDDHSFVAKTVMGLLNDETESERVVFFAASMICTKILSNIDLWWPVYRDVVLHMCILYNSGRDEEELEGCLAVTEPAFATLWTSLDVRNKMRTDFPPSVRLSALARALAISVTIKVCQMSSQRALETSNELLKWNWAHKTVSHEPCMPNSKSHRSRVRLWQLLCGLLPTLNPQEDWKTLIELVMKKAVPINNMGSVRRFMELYLIGALQRNPLLFTLLANVLDDFTLRPQVAGSYAMVAVHALIENESRPVSSADDVKLQASLFEALFPRLIRMCGSNQHLLRIISHIGVHRIVLMKQRRGTADGASPRWAPSAEVDALFQFIGTAPENLKFREKHEEMVLFDPVASLHCRQLFCMQRKEANMWLKESIPALSFDRVRFLQAELAAVLGAVTPMEFLRCESIRAFCLDSYAWKSSLGSCATLPANPSAVSVAELGAGGLDLVPHAAAPDDLYIDYTAEAMDTIGIDDVQLELDNTSATDNLQRKVTSWWNSEVYNELHPRALGGNERQSLVVVGTLLENPVNIAGLCRCGEIFAVEKVIVPEKKVFEHPHFVATARSAELWMPWEEVHPMNLIPYLERMRLEGYVIVGVEQTANSVSMASYAFPDRVVMVLGSEGQGIPAEYLPYLDVCVEIPQYGLIRSLNVHVTGAVVMYEFTKQKLMMRNEAGAQIAKPSAFQ